MKTMDIKGKAYIPVNERLKQFRKDFADYTLTTEIIHQDEKSCTMQAKVLDKEGRVLAVGTAHERIDAPGSLVNKASHIENCETSAWGRALGNFGIGIDTSVASYEEVEKVVAKKIASKEDMEKIIALAAELNKSVTMDILYKMGIAPNEQQAYAIIKKLESQLKPSEPSPSK